MDNRTRGALVNELQSLEDLLTKKSQKEIREKVQDCLRIVHGKPTTTKKKKEPRYTFTLVKHICD